MPTRPLLTRYQDDLTLFPDRWHRVGLTLAGAAVLAYPFVATARWLTVANLAMVSIVGAVALMLLTGFTGLISLGHAAFLALGAYTVAILGEQLHMPFFLALPVAGLLSAVVGMAVGPFALRLQGLYLAIVTLGLLLLVNHVLVSIPQLTHGVAGMPVPMHTWFTEPAGASSLGTFSQPLRLGGFTFTSAHKLYFLFLVLATAVAWLGRNVQRTHTGRAMMAVRETDMAAAVLGIYPARAKITSFGLSSFFAGIAGGMFAFQQGYITIEPPFDLNMSVQYIAMIVLGGIGTIFGAVAGAIAFVFLSPLAEIVGRQVPFLSGLSSAQQATLLFSLLVGAFLIFEPLGLYGIWLRIKRYFMAWPFRY